MRTRTYGRARTRHVHGRGGRSRTQARTRKSIILLAVAPVCKDDRIIVVGASRGESLDIACRVEADPPAHNFRWKFNNSGETLEVAPGRFSMEKSSGVSVLRYTPTTELDYGTLSCWADNLVGTQSRPCLFQLVAAGEYVFKATGGGGPATGNFFFFFT